MSVNRSLTIGIKEKAKHVRILGSATQFQGSTPANITLHAKLYGITAKSYAWYKGASSVVGTSQNFIIANNQVATIETYKVVVTAIDGQVYEDTLSISKVQNGATGESGKIIVQREWIVGDIYRNNSELIDYVYHRVTDSWWKLRVGFDNVTAAINPGAQFEKVTSMEELALTNIIAEGGNIAGFIFQEGKMISQKPNLQNPNLVLDGVKGEFIANSGFFGGFKIESNKIKSQDNQFEIDSSNGTITYKDPTGKVLWYISKDGIYFSDRSPETYTKISYRKLNADKNADVLTLISALGSYGYIEVREAVQIKNIKEIYEGSSLKYLNTGNVTVGLVKKTSEVHGGGGGGLVPGSDLPYGFEYGDFVYYPFGYKYNAGVNEASFQNDKHNGKLFTAQSTSSGELKLADGWWVNEVLHKGVIEYITKDSKIDYTDTRNTPLRNFPVNVEFKYYENGKVVKTLVGVKQYDLLKGYQVSAVIADTPSTWWKFY